MRGRWSRSCSWWSEVGTLHRQSEPVEAIHRRVLWKLECDTEECGVTHIDLSLDEKAPLVFDQTGVRRRSVKRQEVSDGVYSFILSKGEK